METEKIRIYHENYEYLPKRFIRKINKDLEYILSTQIPGLSRVYLFGSCARVEIRSSSDVDLLLVTVKKISDRSLAANIRWTLDEPVDGVRTDVVFVNEESESDSGMFGRTVEKDKKLILEVLQ